MKIKKADNKNLNKHKKISLIIILVLLIIGILNFRTQLNNNQPKGLALEDFYSDEQCRCLEKSRPVCNLKGFEYNESRKFCVNSAEKTVTYPTLTCSKYDCSGIIYEFNFDNKFWEEK